LQAAEAERVTADNAAAAAAADPVPEPQPEAAAPEISEVASVTPANQSAGDAGTPKEN